ncbi:MAG: hypothetical protein QXQ18_00465 [Candidatus Aenigmatarchaeota archaeon]
MVANGMEEQLLVELSKRLVMKKDEIINFLQDKVPNAKQVYTQLLQDLISKGFVRHVEPVGESVVAITQKGMKEVNAKIFK